MTNHLKDTVSRTAVLAVGLLGLLGPTFAADSALAAPIEDATETQTELESELKDLGETLEETLRANIDTEAIERVARPLLRESLETFLDVAPVISRQALTLGEWYLEQLGDRALEELENAQEKLEELEDDL